MEKIVHTREGDVIIEPFDNGLDENSFADNGYNVYDTAYNYLGKLDIMPYYNEETLKKGLPILTKIIEDDICRGRLSAPIKKYRGVCVWVLNVLESYGGLPPTAKANVYKEKEDVLSAKDDVVHEKLDEFVKNGIKHELMDEEGITELRSVQGDIYVCITYAEKEIK